MHAPTSATRVGQLIVYNKMSFSQKAVGFMQRPVKNQHISNRRRERKTKAVS